MGSPVCQCVNHLFHSYFPKCYPSFKQAEELKLASEFIREPIHFTRREEDVLFTDLLVPAFGVAHIRLFA